jgi:hypothetical protein
VHLLPHLEEACRALPFRIVGARVSDDGAHEVALRWTQDRCHPLLGLQPPRLTGIVDETPFKPHGHTLRLNVVTA